LTSKVRVRVPPGLIENARAAQYANRETLAARVLRTKIKEATKKQVDAAKRKLPLSGDNIGGQLEFNKQRNLKAWIKRRFLRRGFLLRPDADYDSENRLLVRSDYGERQYAITIGYPPPRPFELTNGRLIAKAHPAVLDGIGTPEGYEFLSGLTYTTPPMQEAFSAFTAEFFVSLDAGAQQDPTTQDMGNGLEKLTTYDSLFSFFFTLNSTSLPPISGITFSKRFKTEQGWNGGLRQLWGLVTDAQDILLTQGGGEYHVAMTQSGNTSRIYFDGNLVRTVQSETVYNSPTGATLGSSFEVISYRRETLRLQENPAQQSRFYYADTPKSGFRCYRFTPGQALYSGSSFTPPTSIIDLA